MLQEGTAVFQPLAERAGDAEARNPWMELEAGHGSHAGEVESEYRIPLKLVRTLNLIQKSQERLPRGKKYRGYPGEEAVCLVEEQV